MIIHCDSYWNNAINYHCVRSMASAHNAINCHCVKSMASAYKVLPFGINYHSTDWGGNGHRNLRIITKTNWNRLGLCKETLYQAKYVIMKINHLQSTLNQKISIFGIL